MIANNIFFGIPSYDRRVDWETAAAIYRAINAYGGTTYCHMGISDIALARNLVTHQFMKSSCDWFMMVDADIIFSDQDFEYLWTGDDEIVTAPYARKIPGASPANFGLGFTRVHRRVFEMINNLQRDDGSEWANRFYMDGEIYTNFYPNGVTGDSRWLGEDRAFFTLCAMTGIPYRMETRCRLRHVGLFMYGYPNQDNGAQWWTPPEKIENGVGENDSRPVQVM
jgi:hypothetical protein